MARATARHILVSSEAKCNELKTAIEGGADFAEVAREHSTIRAATPRSTRRATSRQWASPTTGIPP